MHNTDTFVIVGGGLAAGKAVEELRGSGFEGRVVLVGAERHPPYERPPLSKGYLTGQEELDSVFVHTPDWYVENDVELRLGTTVTGVDLAAHVVTAGESEIRYDRLLLATGATARRLPLADDSGAPVAYLRTIEDSRQLRAALQPGRRVVVIGGGWIGLEVAAAARTAGCEVTVIEALDAPLLRVIGPEVAAVFSAVHREQGVRLLTGATVTAVESTGGRADVVLGDGSSVPADLLVVGIGAAANSAMADTAGLEVDNGIVVDERLRTSEPDVFAAGDVANAYHPALGRHLRVEHWDNAIAQGRTAARNMLGAEESYDRLPYFFTDQYDLGMEYVGSIGAAGFDEVVVRGDVPGRVFTAFWLKQGHVLAGMHVNDWDAIDSIRRIVTGPVDLDALRDTTVPLEPVT